MLKRKLCPGWLCLQEESGDFCFSIDVRVTDDVVLIWEWRICCGWDCSCSWSGIRYHIVFSMWIKQILVLAFEGRCGHAWKKLIKRNRVMFAQCLWLRSLTWILKNLRELKWALYYILWLNYYHVDLFQLKNELLYGFIFSTKCHIQMKSTCPPNSQTALRILACLVICFISRNSGIVSCWLFASNFLS